MNSSLDTWEEVMAANARLKSIFGVELLKVQDTELLKKGYGMHLDVIKFEKYLIGHYPDCREDESMDEFIVRRFGKEVNEFINSLL